MSWLKEGFALVKTVKLLNTRLKCLVQGLEMKLRFSAILFYPVTPVKTHRDFDDHRPFVTVSLFYGRFHWGYQDS
jgi:hypothetical protein